MLFAQNEEFKIFFSIIELNLIIDNNEPPYTDRYNETIKTVEELLNLSIKIVDPLLWRDILLNGFGLDTYKFYMYQLARGEIKYE